MAYGKTIEEIKACRLAEESGLHKNTSSMITAYSKPKAVKPQAKSKGAAKKKEK